MIRAGLLAAVLCIASCSSATREPSLDELIAADRDASANSARTDLITGITAMLAADVLMPAPGGEFAEGVAAVRAALERDTLNATSRAEWTPVRGGLSADATHGFTFGYLTVTRRDGTRVPMKYLSYWIRRDGEWKVAGYKRARRPPGEVSLAMLEPAVPSSLVPPTENATVIEAHRSSLADAERAFSRDAQSMGLGAAFTQYGSSDAMNLGGPTDTTFVLGAAAIGRAVDGAGSLSWAPDHRVLVASSGDLGVTFGYIRLNPPAAGETAAAAASRSAQRIPFFTVWRRADTTAPWKYIAE
ncbi:MAG TPA: hypothetical protein VFM71_07235 [Gemmatimonadaceae bacterium]|nr:hypothetical protein [Gemmatimonadaceae bacterium]